MDDTTETPIVKENFFEKNAGAIAAGAAVLGMTAVSVGYIMYLKKTNVIYQDFLTKQNKAYTNHLESLLTSVLDRAKETSTN